MILIKLLHYIIINTKRLDYNLILSNINQVSGLLQQFSYGIAFPASSVSGVPQHYDFSGQSFKVVFTTG